MSTVTEHSDKSSKNILYIKLDIIDIIPVPYYLSADIRDLFIYLSVSDIGYLIVPFPYFYILDTFTII